MGVHDGDNSGDVVAFLDLELLREVRPGDERLDAGLQLHEATDLVEDGDRAADGPTLAVGAGDVTPRVRV